MSILYTLSKIKSIPNVRAKRGVKGYSKIRGKKFERLSVIAVKCGEKNSRSSGVQPHSRQLFIWTHVYAPKQPETLWLSITQAFTGKNCSK